MKVKFERREYYDSYGTGNYTEDKNQRFSLDVTEEKAQSFIALWTAIGCNHRETSKAELYGIETDARHYTEYILYK